MWCACFIACSPLLYAAGSVSVRIISCKAGFITTCSCVLAADTRDFEYTLDVCAGHLCSASSRTSTRLESLLPATSALRLW